jgi:hypothetical protein
LDCDEPHLAPNEKTQPIQWTKRPTSVLVVIGSLWPFAMSLLVTSRVSSCKLPHMDYLWLELLQLQLLTSCKFGIPTTWTLTTISTTSYKFGLPITWTFTTSYCQPPSLFFHPLSPYWPFPIIMECWHLKFCDINFCWILFLPYRVMMPPCRKLIKNWSKYIPSNVKTPTTLIPFGMHPHF